MSSLSRAETVWTTADIGACDEQDAAVKPERAAVFLDVTAKTLANWRHQGRGPEYYKLSGGKRGGAVRYTLRGLIRFREARRRRSTSDPGPAP